MNEFYKEGVVMYGDIDLGVNVDLAKRILQKTITYKVYDVLETSKELLRKLQNIKQSSSYSDDEIRSIGDVLNNLTLASDMTKELIGRTKNRTYNEQLR